MQNNFFFNLINRLPSTLRGNSTVTTYNIFGSITKMEKKSKIRKTKVIVSPRGKNMQIKFTDFTFYIELCGMEEKKKKKQQQPSVSVSIL